MFTLDYTQDVGDECATSVNHNFLGAYPPPPPVPDVNFETTQDVEVSPQVFFGRIEDTDAGPVLVSGATVLPGVDMGKGAWEFAWTHFQSGTDGYQHITGYQYSDDYENSTTVRIGGSFRKGSFSGTYDYETVANDAYSESDTWTKEAAAYIGSSGLIPASTYLLKLNGKGVEVAAVNDQSPVDCSASPCTLSVQDGCAWRYTLTGVETDFLPDDARWVQDAGQAAGL
jgi:hypothetical protein